MQVIKSTVTGQYVVDFVTDAQYGPIPKGTPVWGQRREALPATPENVRKVQEAHHSFVLS